MKVLIVGFGNPTVVADSFGPLVGTLLHDTIRIKDVDITVLGTMTDPLFTLSHYKEFMSTYDPTEWDLVIATDAALSDNSRMNKLATSKLGVHPGLGTSKAGDTDYVGNIGILYCVGENPTKNNAPTQSMVANAACHTVDHIKELILDKYINCLALEELSFFTC